MPKTDTSLISVLTYSPVELQFGTSGRRGLVTNITDLEIAITISAEIQFLLSIDKSMGGILPGDTIHIGYDLRPSSTARCPEFEGRGNLLQAAIWAVKNAGLRAVIVGAIPTPALMYYAVRRDSASIMITGSHIPYDRNGYKLNTSIGELLKEHELPIKQFVDTVRADFYQQSRLESPFDTSGMLREQIDINQLPTEDAVTEYRQRYIDFFGDNALSGMSVLLYQHSAVGRDLLQRILAGLGAKVTTAGRSNDFVPIDTEAIDAEQIRAIQFLLESTEGEFDAVVSTDGDSDRPLVLGVDGGKVVFYSGDLLGMVTAIALEADAVVVPISCNDGIDSSKLANVLEPKTKIGSPFVIKGMQAATEKGRQRICGWEANGGFLLGSDLELNGRTISKLATRDAILPIVSVLSTAKKRNISLTSLFSQLPERHSRSSLLRNFPRPISMEILAIFSPNNGLTIDSKVLAHDLPANVKDHISRFFKSDFGFADPIWIDYTDGVRIGFGNADVVHIRPSGNADELRIYSASNSRERAQEIVDMGIQEPDGLLRTMENYISTNTIWKRWFEKPFPFYLEPSVKKYAWGGTEFIADLLGFEDSGQNYAEVWWGDHASSPIRVNLDAAVFEGSAIPRNFIDVTFGNLERPEFPLLIKTLDCNEMLSIQVHPDFDQAKDGFDRENASGIPTDSPLRNYKDSSDKPEMHIAISDVYMLHGFLPGDQVEVNLLKFEELSDILDACVIDGVDIERTGMSIFQHFLTISQDVIDSQLTNLYTRLKSNAYQNSESLEYWFMRAFEKYSKPHCDRGLILFFLMNLVHVPPGCSTNQKPGILHAFLDGKTFEIMAPSDNVIRAGLTPKRIDNVELLRIVRSEDNVPKVDTGRAISLHEKEFLYDDLGIRVIHIRTEAKPVSRKLSGIPVIVNTIRGSTNICASDRQFEVGKGKCMVVPKGCEATISVDPDSLVFVTTCG